MSARTNARTTHQSPPSKLVIEPSSLQHGLDYPLGGHDREAIMGCAFQYRLGHDPATHYHFSTALKTVSASISFVSPTSKPGPKRCPKPPKWAPTNHKVAQKQDTWTLFVYLAFLVTYPTSGQQVLPLFCVLDLTLGVDVAKRGDLSQWSATTSLGDAMSAHLL